MRPPNSREPRLMLVFPKHPSEDPEGEGLFDEQLTLPLGFVPEPQPVGHVVKRDGRREAFDKKKIAEAIFKAAESVGGEDRDLANNLASAVTIYLGKQLRDGPPGVDHIHDAVERVLIQMSNAKTALAYARYRDRRARVRRLRQGDLRAVLGELEEAREERAAAGARPDALFVRTSGETLTTWDTQRIVEALVQETGLERPMALMVALEVEAQLHQAQIKTLTASLVRELVGAKLVEHGLEAYREKHRRLGVPLYDCARILRGATPEALHRDPAGTDQLLAHEVKKEYALAEVFSPPVTQAHLQGDVSWGTQTTSKNGAYSRYALLFVPEPRERRHRPSPGRKPGVSRIRKPEPRERRHRASLLHPTRMPPLPRLFATDNLNPGLAPGARAIPPLPRLRARINYQEY